MISIQSNINLDADSVWVAVGTHSPVTSSQASIIAVATLRPVKPGVVEMRVLKNASPVGTTKSFQVGPFFAVNEREVSLLDQVTGLSADAVTLEMRNLGTDPVTLAEVRFMLLP